MPSNEIYKGSMELALAAHERAERKRIPYAEALIETCRERPELAAASRRGVLGRGSRRDFWRDGKWEPAEAFRDANKALADMAAQRAEEKNIRYAVALSEVARDFPEVARKAREAVLSRKI